EVPDGIRIDKSLAQYIPKRIEGLTKEKRDRFGELWNEMQRIYPDMDNRGASIVKILEYVARGKLAGEK
ncbi:MAG: hypothetical protein AAF517_04985, partial [Planctomycetota bacterium]